MNARVITIYGATLRHCRALSEELLSLRIPVPGSRIPIVSIPTLLRAWGGREHGARQVLPFGPVRLVTFPQGRMIVVLKTCCSGEPLGPGCHIPEPEWVRRGHGDEGAVDRGCPAQNAADGNSASGGRIGHGCCHGWIGSVAGIPRPVRGSFPGDRRQFRQRLFRWHSWCRRCGSGGAAASGWFGGGRPAARQGGGHGLFRGSGSCRTRSRRSVRALVALGRRGGLRRSRLVLHRW